MLAQSVNGLSVVLGLVIGLGFGLATSNIATKKGYNQAAFFALGFFCAIPGLIIALVLPQKR